MKLTKICMLATLLVCGSITIHAQEAAEQFTVATLNVDGLPQKILVLKLNPDGPGDEGTARIGKYLQRKGYDLVMMQEDFSFHGVLSVWLEDDYKMDEWSGTIGLENNQIDFLHLQNHRFACDGLMGCWKNDLQVTVAARTPWKNNFGKFSHANDEIITKGYRRYDVTLRSGDRIVVYNLHMDATLDEDEAEQKAEKDREARIAQLEQLKEDVLQNLDSRPVIITGDMNCLYGRDNVKQVFIDAINETGRGNASDVWVELQQKGVYPTAPSTETTSNGETLDKIIYINPTMGTQIKPVACSIDKEGYLYDGKPLGDHWPLAATFQILSRATAIQTIHNDNSSESRWYNLKGQRVNEPQHGIFIEQKGEMSDKRIRR